jgi:hypothetical protein
MKLINLQIDQSKEEHQLKMQVFHQQLALLNRGTNFQPPNDNSIRESDLIDLSMSKIYNHLAQSGPVGQIY